MHVLEWTIWGLLLKFYVVLDNTNGFPAYQVPYDADQEK